ncbi:MAG: hypothetical protein R2856_05790 [Caldilineaceae bacterium]
MPDRRHRAQLSTAWNDELLGGLVTVAGTGVVADPASWRISYLPPAGSVRRGDGGGEPSSRRSTTPGRMRREQDARGWRGRGESGGWQERMNE